MVKGLKTGSLFPVRPPQAVDVELGASVATPFAKALAPYDSVLPRAHQPEASRLAHFVARQPDGLEWLREQSSTPRSLPRGSGSIDQIQKRLRANPLRLEYYKNVPFIGIETFISGAVAASIGFKEGASVALYWGAAWFVAFMASAATSLCSRGQDGSRVSFAEVFKLVASLVSGPMAAGLFGGLAGLLFKTGLGFDKVLHEQLTLPVGLAGCALGAAVYSSFIKYFKHEPIFVLFGRGKLKRALQKFEAVDKKTYFNGQRIGKLHAFLDEEYKPFIASSLLSLTKMKSDLQVEIQKYQKDLASLEGRIKPAVQADLTLQMNGLQSKIARYKLEVKNLDQDIQDYTQRLNLSALHAKVDALTQQASLIDEWKAIGERYLDDSKLEESRKLREEIATAHNGLVAEVNESIDTAKPVDPEALADAELAAIGIK